MAHYLFQYWQDGDTNMQKTITLAGNLTLTATYAPGILLNVSAGANGSVSPSGQMALVIGSSYSFQATPNSGYKLDRWELNAVNVGTTNPYILPATSAMDGQSLVAIFSQVIQTIVLNVIASTGGSVSPSGSQTLTVGNTYNFTATANTGYTFNHWDLAGTNVGTTNPIVLTATATMSGQTLTAVFAQATVTISVVAGANGSVSPSGSQILIIGQAYSFMALPNSGYQLDHWDLSGANQGSSNPVTLTATSTIDGKTLTAIFTSIPPVQITLNIATSGNGNVNLTNGPHTFNVGDNVQFTATAQTNNAFSQWTLAGASYTANPLTLQIASSMNGQTLTAVFVPTAITLTVASGAYGTVSPSGQMTLIIGQSYLFVAAPSVGYVLDHWDLSGNNIGSTTLLTINATVAMDGATLTALFTLAPKPQITMTVGTTGGGVTNPNAGVQTYNVGDTVQFTAIASAGNSFTAWKLDGQQYTNNPLTLTISQDMNGKTLTAQFTGPAPMISGMTIAGIAILGGITVIAYLASRKKK